jgi:hypothetical protein
LRGGKKDGAGRPPGAPNKVTKELRERFKEFAEGNFDNCQEWLTRVAQKDPAEAMRLYLSLSERILGKVSTSNIDLNAKTDNTIQFIYGESFTPKPPPEAEGVSPTQEEV